MFKRSITADLYAPKNIADELDATPSAFQYDWYKFILNNWQKYQLPLVAGTFFGMLCVVILLDYFRAIAQQELSLAIQRQQLQIQALQVEVKHRSIKQVAQSDAANDLNHDDELAVPDIKYWGMMRVGSSTKALIEINHQQKLLKVGQEVDDDWIVKNFDQELIWLESKQGRLLKISMEVPS